MSPLQKIHCPTCGKLIKFPAEKEGTTDACPSCHKPVWLSHLAEEDSSKHAQPAFSKVNQHLQQAPKGKSSPVVVMLALLIVFNILLGFQVIQLKRQISKGNPRSSEVEWKVHERSSAQ